MLDLFIKSKIKRVTRLERELAQEKRQLQTMLTKWSADEGYGRTLTPEQFEHTMQHRTKAA